MEEMKDTRKSLKRATHRHYCTNLLAALQREVRQSTVGEEGEQEREERRAENTREETGDTERTQVRQRSMARWQQAEGKPKRNRKRSRGHCVAESLPLYKTASTAGCLHRLSVKHLLSSTATSYWLCKPCTSPDLYRLGESEMYVYTHTRIHVFSGQADNNRAKGHRNVCVWICVCVCVLKRQALRIWDACQIWRETQALNRQRFFFSPLWGLKAKNRGQRD